MKNISKDSTRFRAIEQYLDNGIRKDLLIALKQQQEELFKRRVLDDFNRKIQKLEYENSLLKSLSKYGWIYVEQWSRDCDMCESTRVSKYQSVKAYYKAEQRF